MPVLSIFAMKAFQLYLAAAIVIIFYASIRIAVVSGTPEKHKASDGREYTIETEYKYNWFEAYHECARRGSQLLIIDSKEENAIIIDLLKKVIGRSRDLWLGGNDAFNSSRNRPFFWLATGQEFTFTFWADGEPTNGASVENCVHIWQSTEYQWNDFNCNSKIGFICEDNPYLETLKKLNSDFFLKFERLQKDNMNQLNSRFQTLEQMLEDGKTEIQKLQNINQLTANMWGEKLQKQINELSAQVNRSIEQINANFTKKFDTSLPISIKL